MLSLVVTNMLEMDMRAFGADAKRPARAAAVALHGSPWAASASTGAHSAGRVHGAAREGHC